MISNYLELLGVSRYCFHKKPYHRNWCGPKYVFIGSLKCALPIRCICKTKLCVYSLALNRSSKEHSRAFQVSLNNAPLTPFLSNFNSALGKAKETSLHPFRNLLVHKKWSFPLRISSGFLSEWIYTL